MIIQVQSAEQFNQILQDNPQVLMEFYASWCPHCQAFYPILEQASAQLNQEGVVVAQTEIDTFQQLANEYQVQTIPTLIYFSNGTETDRTSGERPVQAVYEFVQQAQNA